MSDIRDIQLAPEGQRRIDWVRAHMPLLAQLEEEFKVSRPFAGRKISVSVHLEAKTARLCLLLQAAGADLRVTGSNVLSTRDDIAAALVKNGIEVFAKYNATAEEYHEHLKQTLAFGPELIIDDGGDFVSLLHGELSDLAPGLIGGCEETTTGVLRMRARARNGTLRFPMIAVNDADCKHLFDNHFGTGQSSWDAIMRTTNLLVAGKVAVIAGYGHCGRGLAEKARGLGARVIVTEVNPIRALEAAMQGFDVMTMEKAAPLGDIFITVTGNTSVITPAHFPLMKEGALLSNAGHFDVEVDVKGLREMAVSHARLRDNIDGYTLPNGKCICVLAEGRLVNLGAGDGHPAEIMDLSFALQTLGLQYLLVEAGKLENTVYDVPESIDRDLAFRALASMDRQIDSLSDAQIEYLQSE